jgi:hypothetical protein
MANVFIRGMCFKFTSLLHTSFAEWLYPVSVLYCLFSHSEDNINVTEHLYFALYSGFTLFEYQYEYFLSFWGFRGLPENFCVGTVTLSWINYSQFSRRNRKGGKDCHSGETS